MLARLPEHKFVKHSNGDKVHYIYADPSICKCLYVGSQAAYGRYLQARDDARQARRLEHELENNQHSAEDDDLAEQVYADPEWNWNSWGPWGPEYGYGPGMGW